MSSEGSVSAQSSGSGIRQFGLYRTIDARTEEFLRLSRKRQIRQGCVCAAISTAITVTVVVVILLIYEYAIAVEWSLVQIRRVNGTGDTNFTSDRPYAERLDRSFFGFDQDYYERMPLLVNALQESNYIDPLLEMSRPISKRRFNKTTTIKPFLYDKTKIRRTSPRPFIFEYRSPTPVPFSKKYGSRSWVENYRNAERLQNIRQVIKYLETTINAKMGDMHDKQAKPASSHTSIAFSGVYVEPMVDKDRDQQSSDMQQEGSSKIETYHSNHQSDRLFNYKPNNPGDVNLLADGLFRFAPMAPIIVDERVPMFKKIPDHRKHCVGNRCNSEVNIDSKIVDLVQSSSEESSHASTNKPKSFSLMLNLFPIKPNQKVEHTTRPEATTSPIEKIYFTTSKPVRFQFRRKSTNIPVKRNYYRYKKPRYLVQKKNEMESRYTTQQETTTQEPELDTTKMIVHVNVYSPEEKTDMKKKSLEELSTTTHPRTFTPITETPFEISSGQVEDFHDGSSGVIPVHERTEHTPQASSSTTTVLPFFDTDTASSEIALCTTPPEVFKFSPEDAKVPDHYLMMETTTQMPSTEGTRWSFSPEDTRAPEHYLMKDTTTQEPFVEATRRSFSPDAESLDDYPMMDTTTEAPVETRRTSMEEELETLIIRLKNEMTTTTEKMTTTTEIEEESEEVTTPNTYVPQINGHSRSFSSTNSPVLNPQPNRKRKLEMAVTGFRTYVPMYVEIKRNKTKSIESESDND